MSGSSCQSDPGSPPRLNPGDGVTARLLAHTTAGPFLVTHKAYSPAFTQAWHEHEAASIDLVLAGGGRGAYEGEDIPAGAGGLGFFRHETRHRFTSGERGIRSMHIVIPAPLLAGAGVSGDLCHATLNSGGAMRLALSVLGELHEPADPSRALVIESLVYELLTQLRAHTRAERRPPGFLRTAREALHASAACAESGSVSLSELASVCGVHPGHLARAFKAHFGVTAGAYHRRLRVLEAARRLARTNEPIARVAFATGFADQAHLTRTLRAELGQTPSAMRRLLDRGA